MCAAARTAPKACGIDHLETAILTGEDIRHIREKIENDPANPEIILTIKGLGYKLVKKDG